MTPIEKIRAEVEEVRLVHLSDIEIPDFCDCGNYLPCVTLRFAEDKLKLAEFLAGEYWSATQAHALLAEVAR